MSSFTQSGTYQVVRAMRMSGNKEGVIARWKAEITAWASTQPPTADVLALRAWLPMWQTRSVYTAAELAPLMPALMAYLGIKELRPPRSAKRVENRLNFSGLPVLKNKDGHDTFVNPIVGRYERYFIVECIPKWINVALDQAEFEREFFS